MMPEYIEREAVLLATDILDEYLNDCERLYFVKQIKNIQAADVAEVRHGEWNDNIIGFCNVCMECGAIVERTAIKNHSGELNYCPNCGADMRGVFSSSALAR